MYYVSWGRWFSFFNFYSFSCFKLYLVTDLERTFLRLFREPSCLDMIYSCNWRGATSPWSPCFWEFQICKSLAGSDSLVGRYRFSVGCACACMGVCLCACMCTGVCLQVLVCRDVHLCACGGCAHIQACARVAVHRSVRACIWVHVCSERNGSRGVFQLWVLFIRVPIFTALAPVMGNRSLTNHRLSAHRAQQVVGGRGGTLGRQGLKVKAERGDTPMWAEKQN